MRNHFSLKNFSGRLPIFPLPKVVHFPNTMLPLHIFEKRYQRMLSDALEGERLIGMAVLKPGWEQNYAGNPEIYPMACLGTILKHEPMHDGRSNILLLGLKRVRIKEIIKPLPYRTASVEILEDTADNMTKEERIKIKKDLLETYSEMVIEYADSKQQFPTLSNAGFNLAELTDALSASLGLPIPVQIRLLEESDVLKRSAILKQKMEALLKRCGPRIFSAPTDPNLPEIYLN
ncbi:MAG: LON peptidase substrate-binding domain-containing protein [Candidatus Omnitrophica bacterium]|nr:LON peptidase substrate-binding domain-containing protein [Candidatus Omnitrophota bacterium]